MTFINFDVHILELYIINELETYKPVNKIKNQL